MSINQIAGEVVKAAIANALEPAALLAVIEVESRGDPYEADMLTPRFLFERHVFHRELKRRAPDKLDLAKAEGLAHPDWRRKTQYKDQGNSAARLALLARARAVDPECTARSCSWGIGQIMGFNAEELGFANATAMLAHLTTGGVAAQIEAMIAHMRKIKILDALNQHDWERFARRYNGPGFKENAYDTKLANAYAKWRANVPAPEASPIPVSEFSRMLVQGAEGEAVRQLQLALKTRGLDVGSIDGVYGPVTREAVRSFQGASGLPQTGIADTATLDALTSIRPEPKADLVPSDLLKMLIETLTAKRSGAAAGGTSAMSPRILLELIVAALAGKAVGSPAAPTPATAAPPILSPIDKVLGGQALVGKKTGLAVVAYAGLAILQTVGVVGMATPTGQVLTALIAAFGGLGAISKVDRATQELQTVARS